MSPTIKVLKGWTNIPDWDKEPFRFGFSAVTKDNEVIYTRWINTAGMSLKNKIRFIKMILSNQDIYVEVALPAEAACYDRLKEE